MDDDWKKISFYQLGKSFFREHLQIEETKWSFLNENEVSKQCLQSFSTENSVTHLES